MTTTNDHNNHVRILAPVTSGHYAGATETLWGKRVSESTVEIDNIPCAARGIALGDTVSVSRSSTAGLFEFNFVETDSGARTISVRYRDTFLRRRTRFLRNEIRPRLEAMGCAVEVFAGSDPTTIGLNVPRTVRIEEVISALEEYKSDGFDYEVLK